jgi:phthiocerol/phenolphthiocerol synthesis type-I polyketide synthase E
VEAHGTATPLGDPVEVAALTRAYRGWTEDRGFCAIGSIKASIGHLDQAAGVAGLIKAVLALEHRTIPQSLHLTRPNPALEMDRTPFYVADRTQKWESAGPRRAGVSSFGIGGTNAHAVLEEAPSPSLRAGTPRTAQVLVLSARSEAALDVARGNLADHLERHPSADLADTAFTLQVGRTEMEWRTAVAVTRVADAPRALRSAQGGVARTDRPVAFLFPGQGSQHLRMAAGIYGAEPVFRDSLDRCADLLRPELGFDLREVLFPVAGDEAAAAGRLGETAVTQPALFAVEYALAELWMSWGVRPDAMLGHSVGEFVAACLAGVFTLDNALRLVAARGRLMQALPPGAMLAVFLPEADLLARLPQSLALAAVNGPATCAVSGPVETVRAFEATLVADGVEVRRLHTSHAFHSAMMDPILAPFRELVRRAAPRPPRLRYVSSLTGTWISADEAVDPGYWARQLRHAVRFSDGVETLLAAEGRVLLEVGPGRTLGTLIPRGGAHVAIPSLPHARDAGDDVRALLDAVGQAWAAGARIDWSTFNAGRGGRRIPLPTYPFERRRYYLEPPARAPLTAVPAEAGKRPEIASWFYLPTWRRSESVGGGTDGLSGAHWIVFADDRGVAATVAHGLRDAGARVTSVRSGETTEERSAGRWTLDARAGDEGYNTLIGSLVRRGETPDGIVHAWALGMGGEAALHGATSVVALVKALGRHGVTRDVRLLALTDGAQEVDGRDTVDAAQSALLGVMKVIPQEYPNVSTRSVDLEPSADPARAAEAVLAEVVAGDGAHAVAIRGGRRWVPGWEPMRLPPPPATRAGVREKSVWMITGGLGRIGRALAEWLAREARARLVLVARSPLPPRGEWDDARGVEAARIATVRAVEAAGGEVIVATADVADETAMRSVVSDVRSRWGRIDGVIHAATAPLETVASIADTDAATVASHLRPKLDGIRTLDSVLSDDPPSVAVAFSSLSSVLGGLRLGAYAAANAALDGFVHGSTLPWTAVNWDGWYTGEGAPGTFALTPDEGIDALRRILAAPRVPRIVVSTGDLQARLDRWMGGESSASSEDAAPETGLGPYDSGHDRPALRTAYIAPEGELEEAVADVWRELLGIARVGADDDFFELGGHSLLGTRVIARLRRMYGVDVPVDAIFRAPTVALLAREVEDRLIAAVEAMSDDEALAFGAATQMDDASLQVTGD